MYVYVRRGAYSQRYGQLLYIIPLDEVSKHGGHIQ